MGHFSLLKGYIRHWLWAVNKHSLHAPFVYHFYTQIIAEDKSKLIFAQIEHFRQAYLENQTFIEVDSPGAASRLTKGKRRKISDIAHNSLSSAKFSRLLYRLAESCKPRVIIELGTSLGINSLYLSASHPDAQVYTFEGCPETARLAQKLFDSWPIKNITLIDGNIDKVLPEFLIHIEKVDLAYLDANHRYVPTLHYFDLLFPKSHAESIFVLDDIYWSSGMYKAWKQVKGRSEISLSLDLFDAGILFFRPFRTKQHHALMF